MQGRGAALVGGVNFSRFVSSRLLKQLNTHLSRHGRATRRHGRQEHRVDQGVHHDVQHVPAKTLHGVFCDRFLRLCVQGELRDAVESGLQRVHGVAVVAGQRLVPDKVSQVCTYGNDVPRTK